MPAKQTRDIESHLEFLGYETEVSNDEHGDTVSATSGTQPNLVVRSVKVGLIITIRWSGVDSRVLKNRDFYVAMNEANAKAIFAKWFYQDVDGEVMINVETALHRYERQEFGAALSGLLEENSMYLKTFDKFWK
jgi:hypothetical protein